MLSDQPGTPSWFQMKQNRLSSNSLKISDAGQLSPLLMCYSSQLYVKAILYKYYSNQLWRSQRQCEREREAFYQRPVPASWTMIQFLQFFSGELNLVFMEWENEILQYMCMQKHTQSMHSNFSMTLISLFCFTDICFNDLLRHMCLYVYFKKTI